MAVLAGVAIVSLGLQIVDFGYMIHDRDKREISPVDLMNLTEPHSISQNDFPDIGLPNFVVVLFKALTNPASLEKLTDSLERGKEELENIKKDYYVGISKLPPDDTSVGRLLWLVEANTAKSRAAKVFSMLTRKIEEE